MYDFIKGIDKNLRILDVIVENNKYVIHLETTLLDGYSVLTRIRKHISDIPFNGKNVELVYHLKKYYQLNDRNPSNCLIEETPYFTQNKRRTIRLDNQILEVVRNNF